MLHPTVETDRSKPVSTYSAPIPLPLCGTSDPGTREASRADLANRSLHVVRARSGASPVTHRARELSAINMQSLLPLITIGMGIRPPSLSSVRRIQGVKRTFASSVLQYSAIIFATIFGYFFFGDRISLDAGVGIAQGSLPRPAS